MKIICSGITGMNKRSFLEKLKESTPNFAEKIQVLDLEEILKEMGNFEDITLFLNSYNWQRQKRAWEMAFDQVLDIAKNGEAEHTILCMHLIYFRNSRFFSTFDLKRLDSFDPDGFLTLIDDVYLLRKRIDSRSAESAFKTQLRLRDLLAWRSMETNLAGILSSYLNKGTGINHYLFPVQQSASMLHKLLFTENLRLYIAHPITSTRNDPKLVKEIEDFKEELENFFVVFDPTTIDERLLNISLREQFPNWKEMGRGELADLVVKADLEKRWPINPQLLLSEKIDDLFPIEIPADEIVEVADDVDNLIQERDYRLISQSDALVAYRPNLNGKLSTGVFSEMQFARDIAFKPCHMYFPTDDGAQEDTPFKGRGFLYPSTETLVETLKKVR